MRFQEDGAFFLIHFDNVTENPFSDIQRTQRIREDQDLVPHPAALRDLIFQFLFISDKSLQEQLLVLFRQPVLERFSRYFDISGAGITDGRYVIDFHIDTIFAVTVLYKDQIQIHG